MRPGEFVGGYLAYLPCSAKALMGLKSQKNGRPGKSPRIVCGLPRFGQPTSSARPLDLVLEVPPDRVDDLAIARVVAQLEHVARPLQRDVDDGLGAAGTGGHDHDLVGERHRLVDAVSDEYHRLLVDLPDAQQLLL